MSKMNQKTVLLNTVFLLITSLMSGVVLAAACTYGEAQMALEQGNTVRGMALMRMASHDGDRRANNYLARHSHVADVPAFLHLPSGLDAVLAAKPQPEKISLNDIQ
ncbi:MAG: hypothetical protein COB30_010190 [Ectothiorhodospiraceae bacterium]|nr:hypothetical protein [Ectothiorhodospiraceae bacterium]